MNKDQELENYLSISPSKFGIYLFDKKNIKTLYKEELILNQNENFIDFKELKKFLDNNIFKIEKLSGKFVENIFLSLESKKILNLEIGIKKKNYNTYISKQYIQNLIVEARDLYRETFQDQEIMHMIINKYLFNGKSFQSFKENIKCDYFALEIKFKSIPNALVYDMNKVLENYQIKIIRYIDGSYVKSIFDNDIELAEMTNNILNGYNKNEVIFVTKNTKKLDFFEKFFQLFG